MMSIKGRTWSTAQQKTPALCFLYKTMRQAGKSGDAVCHGNQQCSICRGHAPPQGFPGREDPHTETALQQPVHIKNAHMPGMPNSVVSLLNAHALVWRCQCKNTEERTQEKGRAGAHMRSFSTEKTSVSTSMSFSISKPCIGTSRLCANQHRQALASGCRALRRALQSADHMP